MEFDFNTQLALLTAYWMNRPAQSWVSYVGFGRMAVGTVTGVRMANPLARREYSVEVQIQYPRHAGGYGTIWVKLSSVTEPG